MEREKVIELARNLGWEYDEEDGHIYYDGTPITTMLTIYSRHLSKLVEQETLERAAKVCEHAASESNETMKRMKEEKDIGAASVAAGGSYQASVLAKHFRNLKDNHDKE